MLESPITTSALLLLRKVGILAWRANSGMLMFDDPKSGMRRVVKGAAPGTPDILLVIPSTRGRLGGIEMKRPAVPGQHAAGQLEDTQERWRDRAQRLGVIYGVAHSAREALALVQRWRVEYQDP